MEWPQRFITKIKSQYFLFARSFSCCDLCENTISEHVLLCNDCLRKLPLFQQEVVDGDLLNWPIIYNALPNRCFDKLFCLSPYISPFTQWIPQFKYHGKFELATLFSALLVKQWLNANSYMFSNNTSPDLILSVPLHINKWQVRGYNQAHLIAKAFAKSVKIKYQDKALIRLVNNQSQVGYSGKNRRKNLKDMFAIGESLRSKTKHIILIDDVVTTGSTANQICQLLKKNGIEVVTLVAVCLTLPKH